MLMQYRSNGLANDNKVPSDKVSIELANARLNVGNRCACCVSELGKVAANKLSDNLNIIIQVHIT
jgi:hypothetical protein